MLHTIFSGKAVVAPCCCGLCSPQRCLVAVDSGACCVRRGGPIGAPQLCPCTACRHPYALGIDTRYQRQKVAFGRRGPSTRPGFSHADWGRARAGLDRQATRRMTTGSWSRSARRRRAIRGPGDARARAARARRRCTAGRVGVYVGGGLGLARAPLPRQLPSFRIIPVMYLGAGACCPCAQACPSHSK